MTRKKPSRPRTKPGSLTGLMAFWKRYRYDHNAADAVHLTLRDAILHGALAAGQPLGEIQLADVFGRSRTPVREAILKLESEGLAARVPRRGLVVAQMTREEMLEVYAVREMLDGLAARLAALGILPTELDRLVWLNDRLRAAVGNDDRNAMIQLNLEFHEAICQASRNSLLLEFMRRIHERQTWAHRLEETTMSFPGRGLEAVAEHEALIDAVRARDPEAAERIARDHTSRARQIRINMSQSAAAHDQRRSSRTARDLRRKIPAVG
jgi:DNA-binding GntR family transcriptional regulator